MKGKFYFLAVLAVLVSGCGENKLTQCEQIFRIVKGVNQSSQNVSYTSGGELTTMKIWLETATLMNQAANKIQALHVNNSDLIAYQNQLVTVYRIYSQATYDAVKARENQNFQALESAKNDAQKAGQMQQDLIEEINAYCLNI